MYVKQLVVVRRFVAMSYVDSDDATYIVIA
jgi:hypothetical protein